MAKAEADTLSQTIFHAWQVLMDARQGLWSSL